MARRDAVTGTPLAFLSAAVRYCFPDDDPKWMPGIDFARLLDPRDFILTGSVHSLLALPGLVNMTSYKVLVLPDVDMMFRLDVGHFLGNFLVETQRTHPSLNPAFCYLRFEGVCTRFSYIKDLNGRYINGDLLWFWQETILSDMEKAGGVRGKFGPRPEIGLRFMATENKLESDLVFCIAIPWPEVANEWTTRKRKYGWPSIDLVHDCVTPGCHVVKKAHPLSTRPDIEWRFSFSVAEKKLGQGLTDSQRVCFKVFKALIQLENSSATQRIPTYYLLTTLFWVCEEVPTSHWNTSSLGTMLLCLLDKLLHFLSTRYLPNYFIPKANLIDSVTEEDIRRWLNGILSVRMKPIAKLIDFHSKFVVLERTNLVSGKMVAGLELFTKQGQSLKNTLYYFLKTIALQYACYYNHYMVISISKMIWSIGFQTEAALFVSDTMEIDKDSELPILMNMYGMLSHSFRIESTVAVALLAERAFLMYQYSTSAKLSPSEKQKCLEQTQRLFQIALSFPPYPVCAKVQYAQFLMTQDLHEEALDILKEIVRNGKRWGHACTEIYFSRFTAACMDDTLRADLVGSDIVCYNVHALAYYLLLRCYAKLRRPFTTEDVPLISQYRERFITEHNPELNVLFLRLEGCISLSIGHVYHALQVFLSNKQFSATLHIHYRMWYCVARLYADLLPYARHYLPKHYARSQARC